MIEMLSEVFPKIVEQFILVVTAVFLAIAIGVILGTMIRHSPKAKTLVLGLVSMVQTIPSLALLALLLPLFGIGFNTAIIALTLYAILPILRNTVTGFSQIPLAFIEAAKDCGADNLQCLWYIELPLAMPIIIAGIRTAVSMTIGIATIAAFIGAGGLGDFITRGLAMNDTHLLLMGAIPAALMALLLDFCFANTKTKKFFFILVLFLLISLFWGFHQSQRENIIRVGTKNFTEQYILGEMISQLIEERLHITVSRKFNLGSTEICLEALKKGDIDIYPDYTGTAYLTIMHKKLNHDETKQSVYDAVKKYFAQNYHIAWLLPLGFENSQSVTVRKIDAVKYHLHKISDLVPFSRHLIFCGSPEFLDRADGYLGLQKIYDINFKKVVGMDEGLVYQAISHHSCDVINAYTTDGRIKAFGLTVLEDDKKVFPPYQAAILARQTLLDHEPEVSVMLHLLENHINTETMQELNREVDVDKKTPAEVAHTFLVKSGLIIN